MTKYSFILLDGDKEKFLSDLGEVGLVDIVRSSKPVDERSSQLLSQVISLRKAIGILESTEGKSDAAVTVKDPMSEVFAVTEAIDKAKADIEASKQLCARTVPWGNFDMNRIHELKNHGLTIRFYDIPQKQFDKSWANDWRLEVISEEDSHVRFVTLSDSPDYTFPVAEVPAPECTAQKAMENNKLCEDALKTLQEKLIALKSYLPTLQTILEQTLVKLDRYLAATTSESAAEERLCVFTGFAPSEYDEALQEKFQEIDAYWISEKAETADNPPISLKNNKFTRMFTVLTDMYGRPGYDGFDPTPYISVFFMLFFAFCMGDAGYGIVLALLGLGLRKVKGFGQFAPLVITLGVATIVVGFLFHTFFSMDISSWKIFEPVSGIFLPSQIAGYDGTMVLALIVGVIHICLAIVVKTIYATKNNGFLGSLGTWGWTLLIVGGVIVGGLSLGGVLDAAVTKWVIIVIGVLSALGIFFLNDLHRNPLLNVGAGLWETYNTATGLLGDVLSYLRLYALGLAGAMLGFAFNDLGAKVLGDGSPLNWVFFLIIILIGHILNIAMAALGAFVHPLRLNFLEFFKNSGYQGGARIYDPLKNKK